MKTEHSSPLQQEQAVQRNNAAKARGNSGEPTARQPFADLLASLGQNSATEEDALLSDTSADAASAITADTLPADAAALAALLAQSQAGKNPTDTSEQISDEGVKNGMAGRRGRTATGGLLGTTELQQNRSAHAPGHLVSTLAQSDDRTLPPPQALAALNPATDAPPTSWHMLTPGHPGSALQAGAATAETSSPATSTDLVSSGIGLTSEPTASAGADTSGQHGADPGGANTNSLPGTDTPPTNDNVPITDFSQNLEHVMDSLGAQVSYWVSNNIRRATMRLDAGLKDALEVEVRIKDGAAHLDFRTDDAQAREALKGQGATVLTELLARSGIDLEGLSVTAQGSQGQGAGQYRDQTSEGWLPIGSGLAQHSAAGIEPSQASTTRSSTGQGVVDVFA